MKKYWRVRNDQIRSTIEHRGEYIDKYWGFTRDNVEIILNEQEKIIKELIDLYYWDKKKIRKKND